ncbi:hypothetical protein HanRHA438_Chr17g0802561 [Helianthus annuus]|nr:putative aldehyde dehydrogenase family 7 member A1 [Helianthus annuus]KAJ0825379.1 hypothetical protein HanRHA438_Chr17g0802561 [Helianthus annuus]
MFSQPEVSDFFAKLIQRVSPKSYQCVSWQGRLEYLGIILGNKVMVSDGHMACGVNYTFQFSSRDSGTPVEDVDFINSDGMTMNKLCCNRSVSSHLTVY